MISYLAIIISVLTFLWSIYTFKTNSYSKIKYTYRSIAGLNYKGKDDYGHPVFDEYKRYYLIIRNLSKRPSAIINIEGLIIGKSLVRIISEPIKLDPWSIEQVEIDVSELERLPRFLIIEDLDIKKYIALDFIDSNKERLLPINQRRYKNYQNMIEKLERIGFKENGA